ncbi:hypothetical protein GFS24_27575 [Chitinophaga sp. SYP-B3965]|uniref:hypothetical protein n=1 Tax=Chitinophaga sp. SYP-B3965 TaxID=2663120 RepID=UPI001299DDE3|nr:hypothetical protein [Chitinophaga sp. SYP-B3965]MRG48902.1 hypothetical protein [Chitinophaga sp. SYP-B3965]
MKFSLKLLLFPALLCMLVFAGCSGKGDNPTPTGHRIKYKAEVSSGSVINLVMYIAASGENTTISNLSVGTWESAEFDLPASTRAVSFGATGTAGSANATIKVQIFVDGVMKKESTATGAASFGANTTFFF